MKIRGGRPHIPALGTPRPKPGPLLSRPFRGGRIINWAKLQNNAEQWPAYWGVKAFRQLTAIALQMAAEWDEGREIYGARPTPEYPKPPRPKRKHVLRPSDESQIWRDIARSWALSASRFRLT